MTPEKLPSTPEVFTGELEKSGGFLTQFLVFWQQSKTESSDYAKIPCWGVTGILLSRFRSLSMIAMSGPHAGTGGAARVTSELVTAALFHSVHERPAS